MNLGCLLITFLGVITAVGGDWMILDAITDLWTKVVGAPCPEKSKMKAHFYSFKRELSENLIGQQLVQEKLLSMVWNHLTVQPQKPLVISMHGWTGSGKNFATEILVENLYEKGVRDGNVHLFSGRRHFPLSTREAVDEYKVSLHKWISGNVSRCGLSTFIFDEIDKVPVEVVDAIKPYLDYHKLLDGVDYRDAIFIFISNVGGNVITKKYIELWESGASRNKMEYKSFEPELRKVLYNTEGAFAKSAILEDHLVSLYLPFFPMEKEHVILCIEREMKKQGISVTDKRIEYVLDAIEFYNDRFSISGCKRVSDQVALLRYVGKDEL